MTPIYRFTSLVLLGLCAWSTHEAAPAACRLPATETLAAEYPAHALSPAQSFATYDSVFFAEVAVPSRACSLGYCAGLKIVKTLKGAAKGSILVQSMRAAPGSCGPVNFSRQGQRWLVFANRGTSKTGYAYWQAEDDSPSFPTPTIPNFHVLETRFQALRTRLDAAIEARLGRVSVTR